MRRIIFVSLLLAACGNIQAQQVRTYYVQERYPRSAVYMEILGNSPIYSFNYDFRFSTEKGSGWGAHIGAGLLLLTEDDVSLMNFPFGLNYLAGRNGKYLELGVGLTFLSSSDFFDDDDVHHNPLGTLIIAYRYQPVGGGVFFRIGITPLVDLSADRDMFFGFLVWPFWAGLSIGYAF
ncbi:MAG: hypothetical protein LBT48_00090 [Prevotellaceae bacterium]|jgi:hypothetical protein|nr:hypothetical protein [Prevotellaceae bacterium]